MNVDKLLETTARRLDAMRDEIVLMRRPDGGPRGVWIDALSPLSTTLDWVDMGEDSLEDAELMAHLMAEEAYDAALTEQWEQQQDWDEEREDRCLDPSFLASDAWKETLHEMEAEDREAEEMFGY